MTLVTPILSNINTIDPSVTEKISFSYTGGQIEKKRLLVTDINGSIVYDHTQNGMQLSYELSAGSLSVGQFLARVQVFDYSGNSSELSDPVLFYCYSTPSFIFSGLSSRTNIINSPNITLRVSYYQPEGEQLYSMVYYLYDEYHTLLSKSDILYKLSDYTFYGLDNLGTYYVRAIGSTVHSISLDTGYIPLSVNYAVLSNNVVLDLINDRWNGYTQINCNIVDIEYDVTGEYHIKDGVLTVDDGGSIVYHLDGDPERDYSIFLKAKKLTTKSSFLTLLMTNGDRVIFNIVSFGKDNYCEMRVKSKGVDSVQYCKLPSISIMDDYGYLIVDENGNNLQMGKYDNSQFAIFNFTRKGNLYGISVSYENDEVVNN